MQCPKDNHIFETVQLADVSVALCPNCSGIWLERGELKKLTNHLLFPDETDIDQLLAALDTPANGKTTPSDFWLETNYECPNEGTLLRKHYFAGTDIGIDQCQYCWGFWLDGDEMQAIAAEVAHDAATDPRGRVVFRPIRRKERNMPGPVAIMKAPFKASQFLINPAFRLFVIGTFIFQTLLDNVDIIESKILEEKNDIS